MRLIVDLGSHITGDPQIIQVEKTPDIGEDAARGGTAINGRYVLSIPNDHDFSIDSDSYILNGGVIDGGDVLSVGFGHLLAAYPSFQNVYFNPLLTADHVGELSLTNTWTNPFTGDGPFSPRFQSGRSTGVAGQMPTHTALLPANTQASPAKPGLIVTESIDIGPYTLDCDGNEVGADEFMVYWKILGFEVSEDIQANNPDGGLGVYSGVNQPALRRVSEVPQSSSDFSVYISTDDGVSWCYVSRMEPIAFCGKTKSIRLAFVSEDSTNKVYLAHYAILF